MKPLIKRKQDTHRGLATDVPCVDAARCNSGWWGASDAGQNGHDRAAIFRYVMLIAGWLIPHIIVYGRALIGLTILCPVDLLALPRYYLPSGPEYRHVVPQDHVLSDLVLFGPACREFVSRELRAGRIAHWQPANYCGAPFVITPRYSPFEALYLAFPSPITLAYIVLVQSLCVGIGAWVFLRDSLKLEYWAAALVSWCVPWIGFMSVWHTYGVTAPVCWLPWLLWAVEKAIKRPWGWGCVGVAVVTGFLLLSGQTDVCGLVLLTSGLWALWLLGRGYSAGHQWKAAFHAAAGLACAWLLGFLLAAPYLLPLAEYVRTGSRMQARAAGSEERPPIGLSEVVPVLLPEAYGNSRRGSAYIGRAGNLLESSAGAFAGLLATTWLAPLAFASRRRRQEACFWAGLAVVSLAWTLNVPGFVQALRLPGLNMLSYNRWVFATAISLLILAGFGLERLREGDLEFRRWFLIPILVTCLFACWCMARAVWLPEPIRSQLASMIQQGQVHQYQLADVPMIQRRFMECYVLGGALALTALAAWYASLHGLVRRPWVQGVVCVLLVTELCWFAAGQSRQGDPTLYFPRIPALEELAELPPGRILGLQCLPPNLNQSHGLWDVRGYDAVDPKRIVQLLSATRDPQVSSPKYATTQWLMPLIFKQGSKMRLSPILDMLNVRYVVLRQDTSLPWPVRIHRDDYWIFENPHVMPRAFVPKVATSCRDDEQALAELSKASFDPRHIAFLHADSQDVADCSGQVTIHDESPSEVQLNVAMNSDGVVVLADQWDRGWHATLDGMPAPLLRANVALRAVKVPEGQHVIRMTYDPPSVRNGIRLCLAGLGAVGIWSFFLRRQRGGA